MATESSVLVRLRLLGAQAFARDARAAGAGLGAVDRGAKRASGTVGGVNKVLAGSAMMMRTVGTAGGVALAAGLAKGVSSSVNFEQSMANVQARLLTSKSNLAALSDQALDLGAKTSFSAQQAADAMGEFAAAGFSTSQIMKIMPGTLNLAAASGTDLAFAAELSGSMIRQFGLHANDAGHVADLLTVAVNKSAIGMDDMALTMKYVGPVAGRFNQSIEDMSASAAILGNVGIKGETAGTTLRKALVSVVKPSGRTMDMLAGMGITQGEFAKATVDASGKLRAMPQILGNLSGQFKDLSAPDRRKALAQLFGVEALPGMVTLMDMGQDKIEKMSGSMLHSGGAAEKTAKIMRGTVKGAWDNFTGSIETASIRLLRGFNPALRETLNRAAGGVNTLTDLASAFGEGLGGKAEPKRKITRDDQGRVTGVKTEAVSPAAAAGLKVREVLGGVVSWAQQALPKLGAALAGAGRSLLDAFAPAMPFVTNVVVPVLKGLAVGVIGSVVGAFKVLVPIIKVFATALGFVGTIAAPLKPVFFGIGAVIGFVAAGPILKFLSGLKYIGVAAKVMLIPLRLLGPVFGFAGRMIGKAAQGFQFLNRWLAFSRGGFGKLLGTVTNFVSGVIGRLARLPGQAASKIGGLIRSIAGRLSSGARSVVGAASRFGKGIVDGIVNAVKAAPAAIASALAWVVNHLPVPGFVKGKVKDLLGVEGAATGGVIKRGGAAIVGERGPELVNLPGGSTVFDHRQTRRARTAMASAGGETFVANLHLDGKLVHSAVFRRERQIVEAT